MMQTQWPGLGPYSSLLSGNTTTGAGQPWSNPASAQPVQSADGIAPSWWNGSNGTNAGAGGGTTQSSLGSILQSLFALLGQLAGALLGGSSSGLSNGTTGASNGYGWAGCPPNGNAAPPPTFDNLDVSSTGDPHLAATGNEQTAAGTRAVNQQFDSMTSHDDLVGSGAIAGGYRVSTAVTQPDANGVTYNDSATVHANFDQDQVTMHRDGTFAITSGGQPVDLSKGQSTTLAGGETVAENADGSLVVNAASPSGGSISTTLQSTGSGVDVTTHAHQIAVGGDVFEHGAAAAVPHHGGRHKKPVSGAPVAAPAA